VRFHIRSSRLEPPEAFEIVSDGGEMDLQLCFGQTDPAHRAQSIVMEEQSSSAFERVQLESAGTPLSHWSS
jgi:hypothetical protein